MDLHSDLTRPAVMPGADAVWEPSPEPGVTRRRLDRIGGEVARATSLVRYAPGTRFAPHDHALGEEFLVLEGAFGDEHGRYPAGTYVRNPPGTRHAPDCPEGCVILVKLRQFDPNDLTPVRIQTRDPSLWQAGELVLHEFGTESVWMTDLDARSTLRWTAPAGGLEVLVVSGAWSEQLGPWSWFRIPAAEALPPRGFDIARVWIKTGHLA